MTRVSIIDNRRSLRVTARRLSVSITSPRVPMRLSINGGTPRTVNVSTVVHPLRVSGPRIPLTLAQTQRIVLVSRGPVSGAGTEFRTTNKQGASIPLGAPMATHSTGVGAVLANATNGTKPCIGLVTRNANDQDAVTVQTSGPFSMADWTEITGTAELAPKGIYYLDTTAGKLTRTSPTTGPAISQRVGNAVSPTILNIAFGPTVIL